MKKIGEPGWRPTEVHPLAALFPMLEEDDLAALADDIKEHGLRTPIQVDADGRLVDGRNRQDACDRASVEPRYQVLNGEDIEALIWSNNGKRRHMSKGQMAMVAGKQLVTVSGEGADLRTKLAKRAGVSVTRLDEAVAVMKHASHLVSEVIAGSVKLDSAYTQAQANKREKDWRDDGLAMLRKQDKDLAQKVADREISLEDARKQLEQQKRDAEARRDSVLIGIKSGLSSLVGFDRSEALSALPAQLSTTEGAEHFRRYFKEGPKEFAETLAAAEEGLAALKKFGASISKRK